MSLAAIVVAFPAHNADPMDRLAGLPLVLRQTLTLAKAGAERVVVLTRAADEARVRAALEDPRVKVPAEVVVASSRLEGVASLRGKIAEPALVASTEVLADPALWSQLARAALGEKLGVALARDNKRLGPMIVAPPFFDAMASMAVDDEHVGDLGEVALRARGALDNSVQRLFVDGRVVPLDAGAKWVAKMEERVGRERAFKELFEACRKPVDGIVATHLNRHVSIWISKRLVGTGVTPNQISVFTFLLAILGAWLVAQGSYLSMVLGAFAMQWNSILDGVDGELARVRFQHSKLGQWVDTICDDASNLLYYLGMTLAVPRAGFPQEIAACGYVAMGCLGLTMAINYAMLIRLGSGDFYALGWTESSAKKPLLRVAERLMKKDMFIFLYFIVSLFGVLPLMLTLAAAGHVVTLFGAISRALSTPKVARA